MSEGPAQMTLDGGAVPVDCAHPVEAQRVVDRGEYVANGTRYRRECGLCGEHIKWESHGGKRSGHRGLATDAEQCDLCQAPSALAVGGLAAHHVHEYAAGGGAEPSNLWALCEPCHDLVHIRRRETRVRLASLAGAIERERELAAAVRSVIQAKDSATRREAYAYVQELLKQCEESAA